MELYENTEAEKIYEAFKRFTGYKFLFRSGISDTLSRIAVKMDHEGFAQVLFYFKNGYALSPSVFMRLNGFVFIYDEAKAELCV